MKRMFKVPVKGGLGNQMFCYAFGVYLNSKGFNTKYLWRDYLFTTHHHGVELLSAFNIKIGKWDQIKITIFLFFNKLVLFVFQKRIISKIISILDGLNGAYTQKDPFEYYKVDITSPKILNGFWQNINYIEPCIQDLRKSFQFNLPDNYEECKVISLVESANSISVHIRRGDYLKKEFSDFNAIDYLTYIKNAIAFIKERVENPKIFVFSDDINWCKENFSDEFYYVENKHMSAYFDMFLMSKCKHNIIANSTFSWWAAMLNANENKIVVGPKYWTANGILSKSFCPLSWYFM